MQSSIRKICAESVKRICNSTSLCIYYMEHWKTNGMLHQMLAGKEAHRCSLCLSSMSESVVAYRPSAFIYALEPILFGGVIYLFPFCACLPITDRNVDEQLSKKSALNRILYAFVSGGLAVSLPFLFHMILWNILAIPVNPKQYESHGFFQVSIR